MQLITQTDQSRVNPLLRYRQKLLQSFGKGRQIRPSQQYRWIICRWFHKQPTWRVGNREPMGLHLKPLPAIDNRQTALRKRDFCAGRLRCGRGCLFAWRALHVPGH